MRAQVIHFAGHLGNTHGLGDVRGRWGGDGRRAALLRQRTGGGQDDTGGGGVDHLGIV